MTKKLLIIATLCLMLVLPTLAKAQSATQSQIDELKKQIASQAAKIDSQIHSKLQNKIVYGEINQIDNDSKKLILKAGGQTSTIITNEYTEFENKVAPSPKITFKSLNVGMFVVGLGDLDDKGQLIAKKVVITKQPPQNKVVLKGSILTSSTSGMVIKTEEKELNIKMNSQSQARSLTGQASTSAIESGQKVIISVENPDSTPTAKLIYILSNLTKKLR